MQTWQLPEHIADILPERARQLESVKEQILAQFARAGQIADWRIACGNY